MNSPGHKRVPVTGEIQFVSWLGKTCFFSSLWVFVRTHAGGKNVPVVCRSHQCIFGSLKKMRNLGRETVAWYLISK